MKPIRKYVTLQLERTGDGLKHRTDRPGYDPNLYKRAKEDVAGEGSAKKARVDASGEVERERDGSNASASVSGEVESNTKNKKDDEKYE